MPGVKVFMALGATIDFEAGTLKRAPKIGHENWYGVVVSLHEGAKASV